MRYSSWKKALCLASVAGCVLSVEQSLGLSPVRHCDPPCAVERAAITPMNAQQTRELKRYQKLLSKRCSFSNGPPVFHNALVVAKHQYAHSTRKLSWHLPGHMAESRRHQHCCFSQCMTPSTAVHGDTFAQPGPEPRGPHALLCFLSHASAITAAPFQRKSWSAL